MMSRVSFLSLSLTNNTAITISWCEAREIAPPCIFPHLAQVTRLHDSVSSCEDTL